MRGSEDYELLLFMEWLGCAANYEDYSGDKNYQRTPFLSVEAISIATINKERKK
jgi:hypothetical protein